MTVQLVHKFGTDVMLIGAVALWLAIIVRAPTALRSSPQRRLLVAVAGIGVSITIYLDPVTAVLTRTYLFADSCGIAMNVWGVLSSAFVLDFVLAAVARRRLWLVYGGALVVSAALALLNVVTGPQAGCVTSVQVAWYSPFWWLLCTAHVVAVLPCAVLCARYARRATAARPLRVGLFLLTAGFASSTVFWGVVVVGFLLSRVGWLGALFNLNIGLTAWLMTAGVLHPLVLLAGRRWTDLRALHAVGGLWRDLVAVVPNVRLPEPRTRGIPTWSVDLRLYRRVIETRDAILILRDYVGPATIDRAREHVQRHDPTADLEATSTACWLAVASKAKSGGTAPAIPKDAPATEHTNTGDELAEEIRFLRDVNKARQLPVVADFAAGHSRSVSSPTRQQTKAP